MVNLLTRYKNIDLCGLSLKEAVTLLTELVEEVGEEAVLNIYGEEGDMEVAYKSPETDLEAQHRLEADKRHKDYRRQQFEKLKAEFEN